MANFTPLNNYSLFILDKLIKKHNLKSPFLDVACGSGYVSKHLAKKGWHGKAIDYSKDAIKIAKDNLKEYKKIIIEQKAAEKEKGRYKTILMFDLLEHIKDDQKFLNKISKLLLPNGHLVIAGPSNPSEWRWDDNFYGHYRRYTSKGLEKQLIKAKLRPLIYYDYTFPVFWIMRRLYTSFFCKNKKTAIEKRTKESSVTYAWKIPLFSAFINASSIIWYPVYFIQYKMFKNWLSKGCAMIVLAGKVK